MQGEKVQGEKVQGEKVQGEKVQGEKAGINIAVSILGGSQILCIQLYSGEEKIRK